MVLFDNPAVKCHLVRKLGKYCIDRRGLETSLFKIFSNVNGVHQPQRAIRAKRIVACRIDVLRLCVLFSPVLVSRSDWLIESLS